MINISKKNSVLIQSNKESNTITRESIELALIHLLKTKKFQDISITEITSRAGVSRNAYYRNYNSKDDILNKCISAISNEISIELKKVRNINGSLYERWLAFINVSKKHSNTFNLLMDSGFETELLHVFQDMLVTCTSPASDEETYLVYYAAGAMYSTISYWIKCGMITPVEKLAEICANMNLLS